MEGFTQEQLLQLETTVRKAVREEMADAGLRLDDGDHVDEARRDFMFLRSLRRGLNGTAAKVGWAVILAILGGIFWLFNAGLTFWKGP